MGRAVFVDAGYPLPYFLESMAFLHPRALCQDARLDSFGNKIAEGNNEKPAGDGIGFKRPAYYK